MKAPHSLDICPLHPGDRTWAAELLRTRWGSSLIVSLGVVRDALALPGSVAWRREERVGLLTYHVEALACEIVTLDSLTPREGIGRALVEWLKGEALRRGCDRVWLLTTNDNRRAIAFYEEMGFRLRQNHAGAMDEARRLKPEIPLTGMGGVPIRDALEFVLPLQDGG